MFADSQKGNRWVEENCLSFALACSHVLTSVLERWSLSTLSLPETTPSSPTPPPAPSHSFTICLSFTLNFRSRSLHSRLQTPGQSGEPVCPCLTTRKMHSDRPSLICPGFQIFWGSSPRLPGPAHFAAHMRLTQPRPSPPAAHWCLWGRPSHSAGLCWHKFMLVALTLSRGLRGSSTSPLPSLPIPCCYVLSSCCLESPSKHLPSCGETSWPVPWGHRPPVQKGDPLLLGCLLPSGTLFLM